MSSGRLRAAAVAVTCALVLAGAVPALAEPPADAPDLPDVLAADLSAAEESTLAGLTAGDGVTLSALVDTPQGARVVALDADTRAEAERAVTLLDAQPSVEAADVAVRMRVTAGALPQYGNDMVRADAARAEVGDALSGVVVAVVDTGVSAHPELSGALLPGYNALPGADPADPSDGHGHGSHVAGTIGADVGSQVEGVAAGVRILPVKVLDDSGYGLTPWIADGVVWAADHGADVINMSLGGIFPDTVFAAAVEYARSKGVTVVAAAGNDDSAEDFYPAAYPGVVGVSAVDDQQQKAWFSNVGPAVDVAAPGVDVLSTYLDGGYTTLSGTSMASPHVAALAALATAVGPDLTPDQVELAIEGTATDLGDAGRDDVYGHGLVDAVRTVTAAEALQATGVWPGNEPPVAPDRALTSRYTPGNLRVDVLAGASDPDGDPLRLVGFTQGTRGTVRRSGSQLVWSPLRSGPYTDTFSYTVADDWAGQATGTVTVTVGAPDPADRAPRAAADGVLVLPESPSGLITYLLDNDTDPDDDPLRIVAVSRPALGSTALEEGTVRYTAPDGVHGTAVDGFTYTVTDDRGRFSTARVSIDVRHPNTAPVAVDDAVELAEGVVSLDVQPTANDTDADPDDWLSVTTVGTAEHGDVTLLRNGRVRYTPSGDLAAGTTDSFTYAIADGFWGTAEATVHVTVVEPAAPSAATVGTVTAGNGSAVVRWRAPADPGTSPVSGYIVTAWSGSTVVRTVTAAATARDTTVGGLTNGRAHTFRVTAVNAVGKARASAASAAVVPRTTPGAPRLSPVSPAHAALTVRWAAPVSDGGATITSYVVRAFAGGSARATARVPATTRSVTLRGLVPAGSYAVRVQAVNVAGGGLSASTGVVRAGR